MCLSSLHSKKSIEGMLFSGILIPYPSKLVSGIHKYWFDDPYFCLLYPFIISSTNALISTVYWLLISGCLLRGDVVPYFLVEGYKFDPVLSFFNYSAMVPVCKMREISYIQQRVGFPPLESGAPFCSHAVTQKCSENATLGLKVYGALQRSFISC